MRVPIVGRYVGRVAHWEVDSRSLTEDWGRLGLESRAERRRMSSMSSVGRGVDFEVEGGERSRDLRAVWISWNFEARIRAVLKAWRV